MSSRAMTRACTSRPESFKLTTTTWVGLLVSINQVSPPVATKAIQTNGDLSNEGRRRRDVASSVVTLSIARSS